jgi:hypothetical protein
MDRRALGIFALLRDSWSCARSFFLHDLQAQLSEITADRGTEQGVRTGDGCAAPAARDCLSGWMIQVLKLQRVVWRLPGAFHWLRWTRRGIAWVER